ncbi:MAG: hypothetical protein JSW73_03695 [Candidatus Woesearchaeota archaeon]|nr:MAG: hypothetical protein JSW73_03695 [Candidatus Woesearchaeota archaeon]
MNDVLKIIMIILAIILISTQVHSQLDSAKPSRAILTEYRDLGKYPSSDNITDPDNIILWDSEGNAMMVWPSEDE